MYIRRCTYYTHYIARSLSEWEQIYGPWVSVQSLVVLLNSLHVELPHLEQERDMGMGDMGMELAPLLSKAAKSLVSSNVIRHGKVPYQKLRLKSMAHAVHVYIRI